MTNDTQIGEVARIDALIEAELANVRTFLNSHDYGMVFAFARALQSSLKSLPQPTGRTDSQRLDWLTSHHVTVQRIRRLGLNGQVFSVGGDCDFDQFEWAEWDGLREAIDAAMDSEKEAE